MRKKPGDLRSCRKIWVWNSNKRDDTDKFNFVVVSNANAISKSWRILCRELVRLIKIL